MSSRASEKAAIAQKVFGRAGADLIPLFDQGAEGMEKLRQQARDLGVVFTQDAANAAADFTDAQNELKSALAGVQQNIAKNLIPVITKLTRFVTENDGVIVALGIAAGVLGAALLVQAASWVASTVATAANTVASAAAAIKSGITSAAIIAQTVATTAATIATAAFGVALTVATGPIGLIALAVAGLIAAVVLLIKNWDTIWPAIQNTFQRVTSIIEGLFKSKLGWILPGGILIKAIIFLAQNWDTIWNVIKSVFEAVVRAILTVYNTLLVPMFNALAAALGCGQGCVGRALGRDQVGIRDSLARHPDLLQHRACPDVQRSRRRAGCGQGCVGHGMGRDWEQPRRAC